MQLNFLHGRTPPLTCGCPHCIIHSTLIRRNFAYFLTHLLINSDYWVACDRLQSLTHSSTLITVRQAVEHNHALYTRSPIPSCVHSSVCSPPLALPQMQIPSGNSSRLGRMSLPYPVPQPPSQPQVPSPRHQQPLSLYRSDPAQAHSLLAGDGGWGLLCKPPLSIVTPFSQPISHQKHGLVHF